MHLFTTASDPLHQCVQVNPQINVTVQVTHNSSADSALHLRCDVSTTALDPWHPWAAVCPAILFPLCLCTPMQYEALLRSPYSHQSGVFYSAFLCFSCLLLPHAYSSINTHNPHHPWQSHAPLTFDPSQASSIPHLGQTVLSPLTYYLNVLSTDL